jgi:hypothetical protein
MCTLIIARAMVPAFPLVVAHARDEFLDRTWEPPARRPDAPGIVAPRDIRAGGTWMGVNDHGLVAAVTNRYRSRTAEDLPSRGGLPLLALSAPSAAAARALVLEHLQTVRHHGFNLVLADTKSAYVVSRAAGVALDAPLDDGLHLVTSIDHVDGPAAEPLRPELESAARAGATEFGAALRRVLSNNAPLPSGYVVCKHLGSYGTMSAGIIWVGDHGPARFELAPGPPCMAAFTDVSLGNEGDPYA